MLQSKDYSVYGESANGSHDFRYILRVTENSISVENNSSSITVEAILVSSYSGLLFYGVNVGVSCTINGESIFADYAQRRCEGTEEHIYFTWTGDILHGEDGYQSITVGGKFWTGGSAKFLPPTMTIKENEATAMVLTVIISNTPPEAPEGLTAESPVAAGADLLVSWNEAADAQGNVVQYELQRSYDGGESFGPFYSGSNVAVYDEAPEEEGAVLCYRVRALDAAGAVSPWSETVSAAVNSAPELSTDAALAVFCDETHKTPVSHYSMGQQLYLQLAGWSDIDGNIAGGQLRLQQRVKTPAGTAGQWEDLLIIEAAADGVFTCIVQPEKAAYLGSIQYRATLTDALGATCRQWLVSDWILRKDIPFVKLQHRWLRPTVDNSNVMPFVFINGRWVRHGGEYQQQDPSVPVLGIGVLGVMVLDDGTVLSAATLNSIEDRIASLYTVLNELEE